MNPGSEVTTLLLILLEHISTCGPDPSHFFSPSSVAISGPVKGRGSCGRGQRLVSLVIEVVQSPKIEMTVHF